MDKSYKPKGSISSLPIEVVNKMLEKQVEQGNKEDVTVFEKNYETNRYYKGFDWDETPESETFWMKVLDDQNFDLFFKKYPKISYPKVMLVSNSSIEDCIKKGIKRVVFMEKNGKFLTWFVATTLAAAEEELTTSYWSYAIDVPEVDFKKDQLLKEADELIKKAEELKKTAASL